MSTEFDPRIAAYFGDSILRAGFMAVPHLFMRHYRQIGLSATHAMFLLQIMESTWDLGDAPKSTGDLARRMGVDKRTIRKYSEEVVALGLLILYDQFDATGAQIENGYDLSPLFERLARFAPEPTPGGSFRRRVSRAAGSRSEAAPVAGSAPAQTIRPAPGPNDPPSPRPKRSAQPPAQTIRHASDQPIQGPRNRGSGLNRSQRIPKNQETCMMHDETISGPERVTLTTNASTSAGWSRRLNCPLTVDEVQTSAELLRRMGIDNPVRELVAPSLGPAEVWALHVYGVAKGWSPGLLVSQVYDKVRKQPQTAAVLRAEYDGVGGLLAQCEAQTAERLVALVAEHCPERPQALLATALLATDATLRPVAEAVWAMIAEVRGRRGVAFISENITGEAPATSSAANIASTCGTVWQATVTALKAQLPLAEVDVWLAPTRLLALDSDRCVIGADNIFVREQIERCYLELIQGTLQGLTGRRLQLEVVVGG